MLVAAIGHPDRGDDGIGPAVARRLKQQVPTGVRVIECGGDVLELIDEWAGCAAAILIDASNAAGEPGRIRRLDLVTNWLAADFAQNSTHAFGLAETVELARALGQLPRRLVVFLVEGERFDIGAPLSPLVTEAVAPVAQAILAELAHCLVGKPD
ncbi:MAG TPA: hydrogenase maturation protease [Stellaceae bacterium]|nr:hydrogenase maturation protease [Stellaceae bacterium]